MIRPTLRSSPSTMMLTTSPATSTAQATTPTRHGRVEAIV
jgi:hypothetical protein